MKRDFDASEILRLLRAELPPLAQLFPGELIVDNFAGGGGTSTGLEAAFGRPVDIAINHNKEALAMHALNHPYTLHLCEDVWEIDPLHVTNHQPVGLVWLSPDCKHFSKAKGGTPVEKKIRGLAWVTLRWAAKCKPRVIMLENVEEFQEWGPLIVDADGNARPDPTKKGKTFESFTRQLRAHGYQVEFMELRASEHGVPTIRKRFFMVARRDGLPCQFPQPSHGKPDSKEVRKGKLLPWRTAAECIDFNEPAASIFNRKRPLVTNTLRRVAKGIWRHVLKSPAPYIVGVGGRMGQSPERSVDTPMQTITAKADSCVAQPVLAPFVSDQSRPLNATSSPATEPLRTVCAQVKGGHFNVVAPLLAPLRGTSEGHMGNAHDLHQPLGTVSAGGTHHAMAAAHLVDMGHGESSATGARRWSHGVRAVETPLNTITASGATSAVTAAHLVTIGYGERAGQAARTQSAEQPVGTIVAGGIKQAVSAAHLMHMTHHGERRGTTPDEPLPTVTGAHRGEQALVAAHFEQANGGFYAGEGRAATDPLSTVTASGSNQQLVTAYFVKYYGNEVDGVALTEPVHTIPTHDRFGLVQIIKVPLDALPEEYRHRAKLCADLLREHLPEHFPEPADLVLMGEWALVDITLRMLKPPELFRAQGFPLGYIIHEIPDPDLLFVNGRQVAQDPRTIPRIPLTLTAQVRMCGNSVNPALAEKLARLNFTHERAVYAMAA